MSYQPTVEDFDKHIEQLKEQVKVADALDRLQKNPDFKSIINEEYLREEAVRLTSLRCDPSMQTPERQKDIDNGLIGVSNLRQFFIRIRQMGAMAESDISSAQNERQSLIEERGE